MNFASMLSKLAEAPDHQAILADLRKNKIRHILAGSYGIRHLRPIHDIDAIVHPGDWKRLMSSGMGSVDAVPPPSGIGYRIKAKDMEIEMAPNNLGVKGFDYKSLMREGVATDEHGNLHLTPKQIMRWKKTMGRPKDLADIKLIEEAKLAGEKAEIYYHGSGKKFDKLRAGSWVTPHKEDALLFGIPWDSKDLENSGGKNGSPPVNLSEALSKLASDQVELSLRSRRGRVLHFLGDQGHYKPLADVVRGTHPARTAVENLMRHSGYRLPQDALKFEGTETRGTNTIHRFSAHAKAGRQQGKSLSQMLWVAANP